MTVNAQEILTPTRAYTYLNDVGGVAPVDAVVALDPTWLNVGLTTPDSLSFATTPEFAEVVSHQSDYPTKRMQTSESATVSVDLQQWNAANLIGAYGGGTVTEVTGPPVTYKFTPPSLGARQEKSCIIEVIDGAKHYRWVFPRVMQIEGVQSDLQKGQEARLPLRLAILGDDAGEPWYLLTDDAAFAPTGPQVTSVTPNTGTTAGGDNVTIAGSGLTGTTGVTFDGVAATAVVVVNDTSVTCTTPAGSAGTADVVVTTPAGSDTLTSGFTYA